MSDKKGLGKGLDALFANNNTEDIDIATNKNEFVNEISIAKIVRSRFQPRKIFNDEQITNLSLSIKENGLLQPIIVKKIDNYSYELIAGERRLLAAKKIGWENIPAIIRDYNYKESSILALIENLQREDLNVVEEFLAYKKIMSSNEITQQELSEKIGKSRAHVTNILRLEILDMEIISMINKGEISFGHAKVLMSKPEKALEYARKTVLNSWSVRKLEQELNKGKIEKKFKQIDPNIENVILKLKEKFGLKVEMSNNFSKGKIVIKYKNNDELNDLLSTLDIENN